MYAVRLWSVRHARFLSGVYDLFERLLVAADPVLARIGYERLEPAAATLERGVKGFLFDCRMCGQCALGSTGLSCPMNCPKSLRNGPCGGVRPDGRCEVEPAMRCVWVLAVEGSRRMPAGDAILAVQKPVDHRLWGRSAWLGVLRGRRGGAAEVASKGARSTDAKAMIESEAA
jgi:Methylene-tetrahydrofolate reductase C terminal